MPSNPRKILISACLLGEAVRYDGSHKRVEHAAICRWRDEGRLVPLCPEVAAGLPTPRAAAEIRHGDGAAVIAGDAAVFDEAGKDCSVAFLEGAWLAVETARRHGCQVALLTEFSPSCGSRAIYDGRFRGERVAGQGVVTAALEAEGVDVYSQYEIEALQARLSQLSDEPNDVP
ncbi:DUF523 domain-containing protein [Salinicola avicenniae]|uniref:DUF523 domain-containing protein n=1 Tax=Salinicola avicenniae TaxID=2916836 RepID=UPI002073B6B9|nr:MULTISPECIES: DUF523 domain-containing protein [unclassified Salinicola]